MPFVDTHREREGGYSISSFTHYQKARVAVEKPRQRKFGLCLGCSDFESGHKRVQVPGDVERRPDTVLC